MKYYTMEYAGQRIHIAEALPSEGYLTTCKERGLARVQDIEHDWLVNNKGVKCVIGTNFAFYNPKKGTRIGAEVRDSGGWNYKPYTNDNTVELVYEKGEVHICNASADFIDHAFPQRAFVEGAMSLVLEGEKDARKVDKKLTGVNPRTLFGQRKDKTLVFVVTDGRPNGLTWDQSAELMISLGCDRAVLADGGGSSTMTINGKMVNNNENRSVYNALQFYAKEEIKMATNFPNKIILHHSATKDGKVKDFDAIKKYHTKTLGWSDIGYHYVIENVDGQVWQFKGRDISKRGAHCKPENGTSIGVCIVGNYDNEKLPQELIDSLLDLQQELKMALGIDLPIMFHRDFTATSCPGKYVTKDILKRAVEKESTDKAIEAELKNIEGSIETIRELMQ